MMTRRETVVQESKCLNCIAEVLLSDYSSVYYVDLVTGEYRWFSISEDHRSLQLEPMGTDFFEDMKRNTENVIYKDDVVTVRKALDRAVLAEQMKNGESRELPYRLIIRNKPVYHTMRIIRGSGDENYVIIGIRNVDTAHRAKEHTKNLETEIQSTRRMAKRDELTGVRNKNAFQEYRDCLEKKLQDRQEDFKVAVVVCDLNNLKTINDTRGHGVGDEFIQRASHQICEVFDHSPVFRVGGDEFVAILTDRDFEDREKLMSQMKDQVIRNQRYQIGPVIACGIASFDSEVDKDFGTLFERADRAMYQNKEDLKSMRIRDAVRSKQSVNRALPDSRRRKLDEWFEAAYTMAGEGYVFMTDMKYDCTRWSLPTVEDFDFPSEYIYHAREVFESIVHPDDLAIYRKAIEDVFSSSPELNRIWYRAKRYDGNYVQCTMRGFVLMDDKGEPEYFGGIILPDESASDRKNDD